MTDRQPSYYRGQLRRALARYDAKRIDGDTLAKAVDYYLVKTERK